MDHLIFRREYITKAGALIITGLLVGLIFVQESHAPAASPEVSFADASLKSGLNIVPASCSSPGSPYLTADGHAYGIPRIVTDTDGGGYSGNKGISVGVIGSEVESYCVDNGSANKIFIPSKTAVELNSFITHHTNIPGVTGNTPDIYGH